MVRVISQETYDNLVKENIDEFEMSPQEAINDAIAQLEAQGVELSHIIKDLALCSVDDHIVSATVATLKQLAASSDKDFDKIKSEMIVLKAECEKDIARKIRAGKEGAYTVLLDILESTLTHCQMSEDKKDALTVLLLDTLFALMDMQPDLLDERGIRFIIRILGDINNSDMLMATLKWTAACCLKHEKNRQNIFSKDIVKYIKSLLNSYKDDVKLISKALLVMRRLCLDDDLRVEFGKAHEHCRELAIYTLDSLVQLLKENTKPPLVSELMLTTATVLVRHELCKAAADAGAVQVLLDVLSENHTNAQIVQQALKLATALSGHDDVRRQLVTTGLVPLLVLIINQNMSNPTTVALGLKCVSKICLREQSHCVLLFHSGAADVVADAMNKYPGDADVQKNACWAIRNIVVRCKESIGKFLELGVEQYLNDAFRRFEKEFGFDVKSALRDLECDVKFQEQWTGKGVQMKYD